MRKLGIEELNRVSVENFRQLEKIPVVCVLDNIRSQHNIGSIFRTADAFRVTALFLCGITATPPSREINKSALGATESVSWTYYENTLHAIEQLRQEGYVLIAVEQAVGSQNLEDLQTVEGARIALIFGNEVEGVSNEVMQNVDSCIEIPQFGTKHSFNVSVTFGIVLYNIFNKISKFRQ